LTYDLRLTITIEVLKQPLHTTIAIDTLEFGEFSVEEKLHIVISVKDFKSIISHAGTINTTVRALYSHPSSPMQLTYSDEGIVSEFILMTTGESRGASAAPTVRAGSKRPASRPPLEATPSSKRPANPEMRPPSASAAPSINREVTARGKVSRPSPPPPQPSIQTDALFFPEADDDRRWDPVNFDEEEDEMLLWDAGGNSVCRAYRFQDNELMLCLGRCDDEFWQGIAEHSNSKSEYQRSWSN
jgi:cell cycle checkpoint control protein RAD9A